MMEPSEERKADPDEEMPDFDELKDPREIMRPEEGEDGENTVEE